MATITSSIKNFVSDARLEEVDAMIEEFNNSRAIEHDSEDWDCYYELGLTGRKFNFFTLYRHVCTGCRYVSTINGHFEGTLIMSDTFVKNLSTDFEEALAKAMDMIKGSCFPLHIIDTDNITYEYNREDSVFHFGKYNGKDVDYVAENDIRYLMWCRDYLREMGNRITKCNAVLLDMIDNRICLYFDSVRKHNEETSVSEFVGGIGDYVKDVTMTVTGIKKDDATLFFTMSDEHDNVFTMYVGNETSSYEKASDIVKGDKLHIERGTIASQYVRLGIKTNRINRVKFNKA